MGLPKAWTGTGMLTSTKGSLSGVVEKEKGLPGGPNPRNAEKRKRQPLDLGEGVAGVEQRPPLPPAWPQPISPILSGPSNLLPLPSIYPSRAAEFPGEEQRETQNQDK